MDNFQIEISFPSMYRIIHHRIEQSMTQITIYIYIQNNSIRDIQQSAVPDRTFCILYSTRRSSHRLQRILNFHPSHDRDTVETGGNKEREGEEVAHATWKLMQFSGAKIARDLSCRLDAGSRWEYSKGFHPFGPAYRALLFKWLVIRRLSPPPLPPSIPPCVIFIIDPRIRSPFNPSPHRVSTLIMKGELRASLSTGTDKVAKLFSYWHSIRHESSTWSLQLPDTCARIWLVGMISWNGWSVSDILGIPRMLVFIENVWKMCVYVCVCGNGCSVVKKRYTYMGQ